MLRADRLQCLLAKPGLFIFRGYERGRAAALHRLGKVQGLGKAADKEAARGVGVGQQERNSSARGLVRGRAPHVEV